MENDVKYRQLCWHSRRGMLELDLVLEPFVTQRYRLLAAEDQARFESLLECEDTELFSYFLGRVVPPDEDNAKIVEQILAFARSRN